MTDHPNPPRPTDSAWRTWGVLLFGVALTIGGTLLASGVQMVLFRMWFAAQERALAAQGDRADFTDNGLSWLDLSMSLGMPFIDLFVLIGCFVIALPLVNASHRRSGKPIDVRWHVIVMTVIVTVLLALLIGVGGTHLLFPLVAAPLVAVVGFGAIAVLRFANANMAPPVHFPPGT